MRRRWKQGGFVAKVARKAFDCFGIYGSIPEPHGESGDRRRLKVVEVGETYGRFVGPQRVYAGVLYSDGCKLCRICADATRLKPEEA